MIHELVATLMIPIVEGIEVMRSKVDSPATMVREPREERGRQGRATSREDRTGKLRRIITPATTPSKARPGPTISADARAPANCSATPGTTQYSVTACRERLASITQVVYWRARGID